jgi:hypothetical protein
MWRTVGHVSKILAILRYYQKSENFAIFIASFFVVNKMEKKDATVVDVHEVPSNLSKV